MESLYKEIEWCGYKWRTCQVWGLAHPGKKYSWYDPSKVYVDSDNVLHLMTGWNPTYINEEIGVSNIGVGMLSNIDKNTFGYGIYEIEAKMPKGKNLWPAFWMASFNSWPPEIDIFEGYSQYNNFYNTNIFEYLLGRFWKIESNIYYGDKLNLGGVRSFFTFKKPTKHFIKYKLIWTEDKIEFYYNNKLNRRITDEKYLKYFKDQDMNIIINNAVIQNVDKENCIHSDFQLKNFKYTKI